MAEAAARIEQERAREKRALMAMEIDMTFVAVAAAFGGGEAFDVMKQMQSDLLNENCESD